MVGNPTSPALVEEHYAFKPRRLRVICTGAGFAGLILAYKHKHEKGSEFTDLTIYEKNADLGGTWFENTYPGAACDVPSHIYAFPFAPNPEWSKFYSSGPEILTYMKSVASKFGLDEYIQFKSRVVSTVWSDKKGKWTVRIQRQDGTTIEDEADILVNGSGILNRWVWPDIPGLQSFQGKLIHSADWDPSLDWNGKRVGLIGNGSSAIQILPQMQRTASSLTTYIRTSTWIIPNFLAEFTPAGENFEYTEEQKQKWRDDPTELRDYRRKLEHTFNGFFNIFVDGSPTQLAVAPIFADMMKQRLNCDEELVDKLVPKWPVGCRRITPGTGYLEALQASNVEVSFDLIERITAQGIVSRTKDGSEQERQFDIIVCATGFDVSFSPAWEIRGRNGQNLQDLWGDGNAEAYMGICAPETPNYFIFNGPNCPIGHGSLMAVMDVTADYIFRWCKKIATENIKSVCIKPDVLREFNDYSQAWLVRTVWNTGCRSWYKNHKIDGKITAMYAGSTLHYRQMLDAFRTEDFDYTFLNGDNRFGFMGNGIIKLEEDGGDLGYYLNK